MSPCRNKVLVIVFNMKEIESRVYCIKAVNFMFRLNHCILYANPISKWNGTIWAKCHLITIPKLSASGLNLNNNLGYLHYIFNKMPLFFNCNVTSLGYWLINLFVYAFVWSFQRNKRRFLSLFIQAMVHVSNIVKHDTR